MVLCTSLNAAAKRCSAAHTSRYSLFWFDDGDDDDERDDACHSADRDDERQSRWRGHFPNG